MNDESLIVSLKKDHAVPPPPLSSPSHDRRREPRRSRSLVGLLVLFFVILALGSAVYFFFLRTPETEDTTLKTDNAGTEQDPTEAEEAREVIEKVGRLILLPEGEAPTVATVSDPEKLRGQTFFEHAKVGHKVLIYTKARKAYLYDPVQNKLIEVAPITTQVQ